MRFIAKAIPSSIDTLVDRMKNTCACLAMSGSILASCGTATEPVPQEAPNVQIDTREAKEYEIPHAEGASGTLSYRDGCLYLSSNGVNTGLVVPSAFSFDGKTLRTEFGEFRTGQRSEFTGTFANPSMTSYACSKLFPNVLIVDYVRPAKVTSPD